MWAALGVGAASLASGAMGSSAAKKAAAEQAAAIDRGTRVQVGQDAQNRADQAPFLKTGTAANKRLAQLLGLTSTAKAPTWDEAAAQVLNDHKARLGVGYVPGETDMNVVQQETQRVFDNMQRDYQSEQSSAAASPDSGSLLKRFSADDLAADPVYKSGLEFGLNEGRNAINARAVQAGGYDSGATLKALTRFGNDYGSTKANESFNRYNATNDSIFNKLSGVSGTGQAATNQVAASGTNMANNVSNLATEGGNARAAGVVGGANAWGGAVTGGANAAQNYQNNEYLKKLLAGSRSGTTNYSGQNLSQDDYSAGFY